MLGIWYSQLSFANVGTTILPEHETDNCIRFGGKTFQVQS
jgi:hypothetical protein